MTVVMNFVGSVFLIHQHKLQWQYLTLVLQINPFGVCIQVHKLKSPLSSAVSLGLFGIHFFQMTTLVVLANFSCHVDTD